MKKFTISYLRSSTIRVFDLAIIILLILIASKIIFLISPLQFLQLVGSLIGFYVIGEMIVGRVAFIAIIPQLIRTSFQVIFGGFVYACLMIIFKAQAIEYLLYALAGAGLLLFRKDYTVDKLSIFSILPLLLLLLNQEEYVLASDPIFRFVDTDYFYYSAIVESIAHNWNINDAIWHNDVPINYQSLTFLFPATLCYNLKIQPHLALAALSMPLFKVFSFGAISASLLLILDRFRPITTNRYLVAFLISLSLMLLAPLNPTYLAKLDYKNFIYLGEGYLLPMGSPGFALSLLLFGIANFYFFSEGAKGIFESILFALLVGSVISMKLAFFIPLLCFYSICIFLNALSARNFSLKHVLPIVATLFFAIAFYKIFWGNGAGLGKGSFTTQGYYSDFFKKSAAKYNLAWSPITFFGLVFYMFVTAMGLKLLLAFSLFVRQYKFPSQIKRIFVAAFITTIISALPAFFITYLLQDEKGNLLVDASFNMTQFLRGGWFVFNSVGVIVLVSILIAKHKQWYHKFFRVVIICWFLLAGVSFVKLLFSPPPIEEQGWYSEVTSDIQKANPSLMAMLSSKAYSGQVLCAKGMYPWWTCVKPGDYSGYICTLKPNYRNELLEKVLDSTLNHDLKLNAARQVKKEGVDVLVATPLTITKFQWGTNAGLLTPVMNTKWLFKFNDQL